MLSKPSGLRWDTDISHPTSVHSTKCASSCTHQKKASSHEIEPDSWLRHTWADGYMMQMPPQKPHFKTWEHQDGRSKKDQPPRKQNATIETDLRFLEHPCCKKLSCYQHINKDAVIAARRAAYEQQGYNTVDHRDLMVAYAQKPYTFGGRRVCSTWMKLAMMTSNNGMYRRSCGNNMTVFRPCRKADSITTWLTEYAVSFEWQPDKHEIHLTVPSRKWVWETYMYEVEHTKDPKGRRVYLAVTLEYFRSVWKNRMPHIKLLKYQRFTMCNTCTMIRFKKSQTRDVKTLNLLNRWLNQHVMFIRQERGAYAWRINQSLVNSEECMSLVQDGSICAAYALPHILIKTKDVEGAARMKVPFVATQIHGVGKMFHLVPEHIKKDSNLAIELIHRALVYTIKKKGRLPRKLYFQTDNCWREYKNMYVLAFLVLLVMCGVFETIEMNFLPLGHTHIDIDAIIARVSVAARHNRCETIEDFVELIRKAILDTPHVEVVGSTANLQPFINEIAIPPSGHTTPLGFKICKVEDADDSNFGRVGIWTRSDSKTSWSRTPHFLLKKDAKWDPDRIPDCQYRSLSQLSKTKSTEIVVGQDIEREGKSLHYFDSLRKGVATYKRWFTEKTRDKSVKLLNSQMDFMEYCMSEPPAFTWRDGGLLSTYARDFQHVPMDIDAKHVDNLLNDTELNYLEIQRPQPLGPPENAIRNRGTKKPVRDMAYAVTTDKLEIGEFVIVAAEQQPGFWVGQIVNFDKIDEKGAPLDEPQVKIAWWDTKKPNGFGKYNECPNNGRPYCTTVDMRCIMFIFHQLTKGQKRIPRQIEREIKKDYGDVLRRFDPADNVTDIDGAVEPTHDNEDDEETYEMNYSDAEL